MKILFLPDIVGKPGRKVTAEFLPKLIKEKSPDIVIANAENLAGGKGINRKTIREMMKLGVDAFTTGNHVFDNDEALEIFQEDELPVLRPANYPSEAPGREYLIVEARNGKELLLVSLLGNLFMPQTMTCPFKKIESILDDLDSTEYDASLVDFHAEATSEKQALLRAFDGQLSAVIGTHTHVQTSDADITALGTAFQADAGMIGSLDSCLGVRSEDVIRRFITQMPTSMKLE